MACRGEGGEKGGGGELTGISEKDQPSRRSRRRTCRTEGLANSTRTTRGAWPVWKRGGREGEGGGVDKD